jgi:hypothetical protein
MLTSTGTHTGRKLVRLSDSLFFAPQSDSEKKEKRHSKELREKRPNPGSFWFTAVGGSFFFSDTRTSEWQVWPWNEKNGAHQSSPYYVSLVRNSILVDTQRLKCIISKQTSSKQHVLALGLCVWLIW